VQPGRLTQPGDPISKSLCCNARQRPPDRALRPEREMAEMRAARKRKSRPAQALQLIPSARLFRFQRPQSNFLAFLLKVKNSRITFETVG